MALRRWILVGGVLVAGAAIVAALAPATVLDVENAGERRSVRMALPGDRFAVTYHHSMYDAPVTEEFSSGPGDTIQLLSVRSPSAAVREYFGLTGAGERHAVDRTFHEIVVRIAAGPEQRLRTALVDRSFLDFGSHGDRLVLHVRRAPALKLLLDHPTTQW